MPASFLSRDTTDRRQQGMPAKIVKEILSRIYSLSGKTLRKQL